MSDRRCPQVSAATRTYYPLDEILEIPRIRILRALQHFDRASTADLAVVLDIEEGTRASDAFSNNIRNLYTARLIARDESSWPFEYSITAKGRRELQQILARGNPHVITGLST